MLFSTLLASRASAADVLPERVERSWAEALVKEHYDFIWRLLRRMGLDAADADDAAQQVYLVALARRERTIKAGSERSFLFGVTLRVCQEFRRKRVRQAKHDPVSLDLVASGEQPDAASARQQAWQRLQSILERMPEDVRVAFILFELEGMTSPEIAELVDAPVGTVASRLRRGRELFQTAVEDVESASQLGAETWR